MVLWQPSCSSFFLNTWQDGTLGSCLVSRHLINSTLCMWMQSDRATVFCYSVVPSRALFASSSIWDQAVSASVLPHFCSFLCVSWEVELLELDPWSPQPSNFCLGLTNGKSWQETRGQEEKKAGLWRAQVHSLWITWIGCKSPPGSGHCLPTLSLQGENS